MSIPELPNSAELGEAVSQLDPGVCVSLMDITHTNESPQTGELWPMEPGDYAFFLNAKKIVTLHRRGLAYPESGHSHGNRAECQECGVLALDALAAFSGRARSRGWSREAALENLQHHPAIFDSVAKDGLRAVATGDGRLAKPYDAAFGAEYLKALTRAANAGLLSVPVRTAQELLGFAIRAAQDPNVTIEPGSILPLHALEGQMNAGPYPLPRGLPASQLWDEIVAACNGEAGPTGRKAPRAASLLNDHVFAHTSAHARHVATASADIDGDRVDLIESAETFACWGVDQADSTERDLLTRHVADLFVQRRVSDPDTARTLTSRFLVDEYGVDLNTKKMRKLVEQLAENTLLLAVRELSISEVASALTAAADTNIELAATLTENIFERNCVWHPYDLSTQAGQCAHRRWIEVAAREALGAARRQRNGTRRSGSAAGYAD